MDLRALATHKALQYGVDPTLAGRLITQESNWNPAAVSPAGAVGLMQIMPATGQSLGVPPEQLSNPVTSIDAGMRYLGQLTKQFGPTLAVPAYNAGPGRIQKLISAHGPSLAAVYPHLPAETKQYVNKILGPVETSLPVLLPRPRALSAHVLPVVDIPPPPRQSFFEQIMQLLAPPDPTRVEQPTSTIEELGFHLPTLDDVLLPLFPRSNL